MTESRIRALIVDDEEIARIRLRGMVEALPGVPIEVIGEAQNGGEALERIEEMQPTLVFLDLRMPVGSSRVDLQACKLEYSIVSPK